MPERATKRWPNPSLTTLYELALAVLWLRDGKHEAHGTITLTANAGTTTINDERIGGDSKVFLFPYGTANAATEFGAGTLRAATPTKGACVITHANNANADRTFWYLIVG